MSENRDRVAPVELVNRGKQEILEALDRFLESEDRGTIEFEKAGETFSVRATSTI
jgi:hypothetical protein